MHSFKKQVAIVVPIYKKNLTAGEKISMKHLIHFLGHYDKYFIAPPGLEFDAPGFKMIRFHEKNFKSVRAYSKLLKTKEFYKAFKNYRFILIYQLDALIFSDQLEKWCDKGYDYIGAPWINSEIKKLTPKYNKEDHCGNGGFSLRNVEKSIAALKNGKKIIPTATRKLGALFSLFRELTNDEKDLFKKREKNVRKYLWLIKEFLKNLPDVWYEYNEDIFWSFDATKYYPDFKVAPVEDGLKFAFEVGPKYCFKKNNNKLPFGCHAWEKYDKEFWLPYLLKK